MDQTSNNLPAEDLQPLGRDNFTSYALAFLYLLNTVRLQHRKTGGLVHHNHYPSKLYEQLLDHHRKANISASYFHAEMKKFYYNNTDNNIRIVTLGKEFMDLNVMRDGGQRRPMIDLGFNLNLLGTPRDYSKPPKITRVEVRMLIPALRPFSLNPTQVQYNLSINQFNESTYSLSKQLFATPVWFPWNKNKWISFSNSALLKAAVDTKEWPTSEWQFAFYDNPQNLNIRISGLPVKPLEAYMHVTLDDYLSICDDPIQRLKMKEQCAKYIEEDVDNCDWLRKNQSRVDCCKNRIPFDSPDLDNFGVNITLLAHDFHAPALLEYSFCGEHEVWKQPEECIASGHLGKRVLTSDWLEPSKLVETDIMDFDVASCTCKSC